MSELNVMTQADLDDLWAKIKSRFVDDIGFSSNKLTWKVGGVAKTPFTIGYATKATNDSDGNAINTTYLKLAGGTMANNAVISRTGSSAYWYQGRVAPIIKTTSYTGYNAILSMKTTNGSWDLGVYSDDTAYLTYITDENFDASTNTPTYQLTFPKKTGTLVVNGDLDTYQTKVSALGNSTQPVYISGSGTFSACTPYADASVASAGKLTTARTINGTSFDGAADITTANWGTARNISIADSDSTNTGTAVSVNGSAAVTLKLPATIKATLSGNATSATKASNDSDGNAINTTYLKKSGGVLDNGACIGWKNSSDTSVDNLVTYNSLNEFVLGYHQREVNATKLFGKSIVLYTNGSTPRLTIDSSGTVTIPNQVVLSAAQGTAPLSISSNTLVTNLNADLLDGQEGSYYQPKVSALGSATQPIYISGSGTFGTCNVDTEPTQSSANLITSGAVWKAIDDLPEPMVMRGTLGTNGTITSLPTASASNEGDTYKVITAGTYASQAAKVGDVFVSCKPVGASAYEWILIPAGDTDTDTWRNIKVNGTEKLTTGISSGAVDFVNGTNTTVSFNATGNKIQINASDTATAVDNILDGSNNGTAITYAPYESRQDKLCFYTGTTAPNGTTRLNANAYLYATRLYDNGTRVLTSHQTIYGLTIKNPAGTNTLSYDPKTAAASLTGELIHSLTNVSGTAEVTTSGSRNAAIWEGTADGVTSLYTGLMVTIKVPVAGGANYGTVLDVQDSNGNSIGGEHPVCANVSTVLSTRYAVGCIITLIYDNEQTASAYKNNASKPYDGVWKIADYNTNDTGVYIRTSSTTLPAKFQTGRRRLLFTSPDGNYLIAANESTNTSDTTAKTPTTEKIDPFAPILYYGATTIVNANDNFSTGYLFQQYNLSLGYSFNTTGSALTLTYPAPVYLKCTPQPDGSAIIDATTPYVQTLPTTDGDSIYIFLGIAYSATNIELNLKHPVYWHKDGKVQLYTPMSANALRLTTVSKTAWGQTFWTANGVPDTISGDMTGVGNIAIDNNKAISFYNTASTPALVELIKFTNAATNAFKLGNDSYPTYVNGSRVYLQKGGTTKISLGNNGNIIFFDTLSIANNKAIQWANTSSTYLDIFNVDSSNKVQIGNSGLSSVLSATDFTFKIGSNTAATIDTNKNFTSQGDIMGMKGVAANGIANLSVTQVVGTDFVTQVKVGATTYSPTDGLISLPEYPTLSTITGTLPVSKGGTGSTTADGARYNLGITHLPTTTYSGASYEASDGWCYNIWTPSSTTASFNVNADIIEGNMGYVLIVNTLGSEITVSIVNGSSGYSHGYIAPASTLKIPAGKYVEVSYIVEYINSEEVMVISWSNIMNKTSFQ